MITRCGIVFLCIHSMAGSIYIVDIKSENPNDQFFLPARVKTFQQITESYYPAEWCHCFARYHPNQINIGEPTIAAGKKHLVCLRGILFDGYSLKCKRLNHYAWSFFLYHEYATQSIMCVQECEGKYSTTSAEIPEDRIQIPVPKNIEYYPVLQNFDTKTSYWVELLFVGDHVILHPVYPITPPTPGKLYSPLLNHAEPVEFCQQIKNS